MTGSNGIMATEVARWLVAVVGGSTAIGAPLVDYFILGRQHMSNPRWPPHARFHNGQSIIMGTFQGLVAVAMMFSVPVTPTSLIIAAFVSASYWVAALGAILFPGTDWTDPEFQAETPRPFGLHIQQLLGTALLTMLAVAVGLAVL
jgi:hypothetical protein